MINKPENQRSETLPALSQPVALSPFLSKREMIFVKATGSPVLSSMTQNKAEQKIMELINRAFAELGHVPPGTSLEERRKYLLSMTQLIINDLTLYFPHVRLSEVANAIACGIRHEYGDYFGFNVISIHGFVEKYLDAEERREALARQKRYLESLQEPEALTPEQIAKIMADGLKECRETYLTTGRIIDCGNVNYRQLVDSGALVLTTEERQEIYNQARQEVALEHATNDLSLSKKLFLIRNPPDLTTEYIIKARDIALRRYFDKESAKANITATTNIQNSE